MLFGMTSEWREIAEWDWVCVGRGDRLHAVATLTNDADEDWYGVGTTECGLATDYMHIPGIFSRMAAPRCQHCCTKVGLPQGKQSPKNVDECRPTVEDRIARLTFGRRNCPPAPS